MQKHDWIIEVCVDLRNYAIEHNLVHLETHLNTAVIAAQHDVLLAGVDAVHHATRDCSALGAHIGICNHQDTGNKELVVVRRQ